MGTIAIDNTAEKWAEEEGEAKARARARPFKKAVHDDGLMRRSAKRVLDDAREAGIPESEIDRMKGRMKEWVGVVRQFRGEIADIHGLDLSERDRRDLLEKVLLMRDQRREEIFGERS